MAIDRIGPSASLLAALRAEVSRARETRGGKVESKTPAVASRRRDGASLRRELKDILKGVRIDDEDAMGQARIRVVRAVLLWEFGPQLREYGEWQPMIDTLVGTLERSETHKADFERMVRELGR